MHLHPWSKHSRVPLRRLSSNHRLVSISLNMQRGFRIENLRDLMTIYVQVHKFIRSFYVSGVYCEQGWKLVKSVSGMTLIPTRTDGWSGKVGQNKARIRSMLCHGTEPVPILVG